MCNIENESKKDLRTKKMACYHAAEIVKNTEIDPAELVKHYDITLNQTEPDVKEDIKELYSGFPKVELSVWKNVNSPKGEKKKFDTQIKFIDRMIAPIFDVDDIYVVGTHEVGDTLLPVYQFGASELELTFSSDFHGWEVVIVTKRDLTSFKQTGEFRKTEMLFEGFPEDVKCTETIFENPQKFSIKLASDYELYTFVYNLKNHLSR